MRRRRPACRSVPGSCRLPVQRRCLPGRYRTRTRPRASFSPRDRHGRDPTTATVRRQPTIPATVTRRSWQPLTPCIGLFIQNQANRTNTGQIPRSQTTLYVQVTRMSSACLCDSTDITLKCAIGDIHLSQSVAQNNDRFNLKKRITILSLL